MQINIRRKIGIKYILQELVNNPLYWMTMAKVEFVKLKGEMQND